MSNLQKYKAKICLTASGILIFKHKILLIKHKKLGIWLSPGGHIDQDECPHQAAEREFFEETGVKVKAINTILADKKTASEFVPVPIFSNLHWICQENYRNRLKNPRNYQVHKIHSRGCEQHLGMSFLVKPVKDVKYKQNIEETDGIAWFALDEIDDLETQSQIKIEIKYAFKIYEQIKN